MKKTIFYIVTLFTVLWQPVYGNTDAIKKANELANRNVSAELTAEFISILNTCEFARYASNTGQQEMGNLYAEAIEAISKLENQIKKQ